MILGCNSRARVTPEWPSLFWISYRRMTPVSFNLHQLPRQTRKVEKHTKTTVKTNTDPGVKRYHTRTHTSVCCSNSASWTGYTRPGIALFGPGAMKSRNVIPSRRLTSFNGLYTG